MDPKDDYDIAHINTLGMKSWKVLKQAKKQGKPVVYHTHTTSEDFKGSIKFSNQMAIVIKLLAKSLFNKADYLISPSEYTKNLIDTKYTHGKKEIRVISNGVDIEKFSKKEDLKEIFLKEYNIDSPVVVTAGLPFERKGIIEFVKVVEKFPEYRFFWFGASSIKPLLPKRIQKIIEMPPKNLMFPGFVDEEILLGAFSAADLFLFMTYEENEGIVVLESLSTKLPILLRDIPVYNGWLEDGKNCIKAKTTADFIEKLEVIVNNKVENIEEIKENGREVARTRDLAEVGKKYKEYYEHILEEFGKKVN